MNSATDDGRPARAARHSDSTVPQRRRRGAGAPVRRIGPYRIEKRLGEGGMGKVYQAFDERLERRVALKQIRPEALARPRAQRRFWREARAAARLDHPGVVKIHDVFAGDAGEWIVMELVEGPTLAQLLAPGALRPQRAVHLAAEIADALKAAHAAGIVHRDLKAANIVVTCGVSERIKILDFGLAKPVVGRGNESSISADGQLLGTPHAMSPEQAMGRKVDLGSDLFSLGTLLYQMVTGELPFSGSHPTETLRKICTHRQRPARELDRRISSALSDFIDRLLEKEPSHRPRDAAEVLRSLRSLAGAEALSELTSSAVTQESTVGLTRPVRDAARPDGGSAERRRVAVMRGDLIDEPAGLPGLPEPPASRRADGVPEPESWEESAAEGTALVARHRELDLLLSRWQLVREGVGQVVLVSGEAGIGKSRLIRTLKEHLGDEPQRWLAVSGSPYSQNSPLDPVITILRRLLGRRCDDTASQQLDRLEAFLDRHGMPLAESVPLLASLLDLPTSSRYPPCDLCSEARRQKTLEASAALFMNMAERRRTILVVEDLHWVDPTTLELLGWLFDQVNAVSLCILLTCRPHFQAPWRLRTYPTQINLSQLSAGEAESLVRQVASGHGLPDDVVGRIVAKTDGVPLFIEELTKSVLESGSTSPRLSIPATLRDSLTARLDRLGPAKALAQLAAGFGRTFDFDLLSSASTLDPATLRRHLERLTRAELVFRKGIGSRAQYVFKHVLIRDVAYDSLRKEERRQMHRRIADVLEDRFADTGQCKAELLAHHLTAGGAHERAADAWHQAGRQALQRSAVEEAVHHLRQGLGVLENLPASSTRSAQELAIQLTLVPALFAVEGQRAPGVELAYSQAQELCGQLDTATGFEVLWGRSASLSHQGKFRRCLPLCQQMLHIAESLQHDSYFIVAYFCLGINYYHLGQPLLARRQLEAALDLESADSGDFLISSFGIDLRKNVHAVLGLCLWILGEPDRALDRCRHAVDWARRDGHPFTLAANLYLACFLFAFQRAEGPLRETAEELAVLSNKYGLLYFDRPARSFMNVADLVVEDDPGRSRRSCERLLQNIDLENRHTEGSHMYVPFFMAQLCEAQVRRGHVEGVRGFLEQALELAEGGEVFWEAELHRLLGDLELAAGSAGDSTGKAAAFYRKAVDTAREQSAKPLELRAAKRLDRLAAGRS